MVKIIVINRSQITGDPNDKPLVAINPIIKRHPHKPRKAMREGCLSIPTFFERVKRFEWIEYNYIDYVDGTDVHSEVDGLMAAAVQHEIDHLNGILFIDRIDIEMRALLDANWENMLKSIMQEAGNAKEVS